MEQIFADRAVALSRAIDFAEDTGNEFYIVRLNRGFAVCDAKALQKHRPAEYMTINRNSVVDPNTI